MLIPNREKYSLEVHRYYAKGMHLVCVFGQLLTALGQTSSNVDMKVFGIDICARNLKEWISRIYIGSDNH